MFSLGQELALEQLDEICLHSKGVIKAVSDPEHTDYGMRIRILISTTSYKCMNGGLEFKPKEKFDIYVPRNFPFSIPKVKFIHKRYLGTPHVQWGTDICLYLSPDVDWDPQDALYGFFDQLDRWLKAASVNNLDPADAPPHPPVAYDPNYKFNFVIQASTPAINNDSGYWTGYAILTPKRNNLFELNSWVNKFEEVPINQVIAPTILFDSPFPFEYPRNVFEFLDQLKLQNISKDVFCNFLFEQLINIQNLDEIFLVVGSPLRKDVNTLKTEQHIEIWRISKNNLISVIKTINFLSSDETKKRENFLEWAKNTPIEWCRVFENRKELTKRRDEGSSANWFRDQRVLLLGCGALGSHIAEYIVRAGVKDIMLVDSDIITPGIPCTPTVLS